MRPYRQFAACAFSRGLAYRASVLTRVVGNLASVLVQVAIWQALLGQGAVAGIDLPAMVTYAILSTCMNMLMLSGYILRTVDERLSSGQIAVDLLKPLSYPLYLAADSLGTVAFQGLFTMVPTLVVAAAVFGLQPPASALHLAAFVVALLLAAAMSFAIGYLMALLAFWFLTTMHFEWSIGAFVRVFGGGFVPLWFFPNWLGVVAAGLPFQYLYFVPIAIYLGQVPAAELGARLILGVAWVVVLLALAKWIWDRSMRRLVLQGG